MSAKLFEKMKRSDVTNAASAARRYGTGYVLYVQFRVVCVAPLEREKSTMTDMTDRPKSTADSQEAAAGDGALFYCSSPAVAAQLSRGVLLGNFFWMHS